jgi:hypothetical protein
MTRGEWADE